jgi:hypothetical protein
MRDQKAQVFSADDRLMVALKLELNLVSWLKKAGPAKNLYNPLPFSSR